MLNKLLLTGATGRMGQQMRPYLPIIAKQVLLTGRAPLAGLAAHEAYQSCDLADSGSVESLFDGVDGVIHLGGYVAHLDHRGEEPFAAIVDANIRGTYNIFEAARRHGRPRIVFASSNHVVGYYRRDEFLDNTVPPRPDSLYGVSKVFGEALASFYHDRYAQECLSVRIGSCFPEPADHRMLATWIAVEDFVELCRCGFAAPRLGHAVVYGMSNNDEVWWDNRNVGFLGWKPQHNAAEWRQQILATTGRIDPNEPAVVYQGGTIAAPPAATTKSR